MATVTTEKAERRADKRALAVTGLTALGGVSLGYLLSVRRQKDTGSRSHDAADIMEAELRHKPLALSEVSRSPELAKGNGEANRLRREEPAAFKTPGGEAEYMAAYDNTLSKWPVPCKFVHIPTRFGSTHVIVSGPENAPPVVLLHGHSTSSTMWYPNVGELSHHYRTYAVDAMGQPGKSVPTHLPEKRRDFATWLGDVFDGLGIERAHVIGLSYGGWLALNFALAAPEKVERLVLLDPAASFVPLNKQFFIRGFFPVLIPIPPLTGAALKWFFRKTAQINGPFARQFHLGFRHFKAWARVFPTVFTDDELRGLKAPTLLLMGRYEVIYDPVRAIARATRLIPHIEAVWIPDAAHMTAMEQPARVNALISQFLAQQAISHSVELESGEPEDEGRRSAIK